MKWWDWMPWSSFSECWTLSQLRHLQISVKTVMYHYGMISSQLSQLSGSQQDQLDGLDRVVVSSNEIVDTKVLHKSHISLNTNHVWHWGFATAVFRAGNHCNPFLRTCLQGYQQTTPTSRGGGMDFFLNAVNRTLYCVKIEDALKF